MLKRPGTFASGLWDRENRRVESGSAISVSFHFKTALPFIYYPGDKKTAKDGLTLFFYVYLHRLKNKRKIV